MKKTVTRIILILLAIAISYLIFVILYGTITNYKPEPVEIISSLEDPILISDSGAYSALIWNIGYAGLGANMDFFYDGGEKVRDSKENVERNLAGVGSFLEQNDWIDFFLLQEMDIKSKRSYKGNQLEYVNSLLPAHFSFNSLNYNVKFVPMPFFEPMGKVQSGLASYSTFVPSKVTRHSFPGNFSWPKGVFMLDRCFMVMRIPLENGKELLVINTHNSAYDDGSLRQRQMDFMKKFLLEEEEKGNYVLVGGDWNQCAPNFKDNFRGHVFDNVNLKFIEEGYPAEGWKFSYDSSIPTNRRVKAPYEKGSSKVTLIDYFLSSPNIEVLEVQGVDLDFLNSDHQPVLIRFQLK